MAKIELNDVSLTFNLRKSKNVTLKQYLLKGLFISSLNPKIPIHALTNINLSAGDGDRIGIIGHNGAGKTTILKLLAGVYPPTKGTVRVQGKVCSLFDISLGFEGEASGWQNIRYRGYLQGETPKSLAGKVAEIAAFCELGDFLDVPVRFYSAGMQVRLAFAIATAAEPEVLLLDEVLGVGDAAFLAKAKQRMQDMMKRAALMVLVSHDLEAIRTLCNRVLWMEQGSVRMDGDPSQVIDAYKASVSAPNAAHHVGGRIGGLASPEAMVQAVPTRPVPAGV